METPDLPRNCAQDEASGNTALHDAVQGGDIDAIEELLSRWQFNPNTRNSAHMTPLHIAASQGFVGAVHCLLSHRGFKPSLDVGIRSHEGTALDIAIASGALDVVDTLCRDERVVLAGAHLELAITLKQAQVAIFIIESGKCNVNEFSPSSGLAPIHLAVLSGKSEIVDALVNVHEIDVNVTTRRHIRDVTIQSTPLAIAIEKRLESIVSLLLLSSSIDPNIHRPLRQAVEIGDAKAVKMLLQNKRLSQGKWYNSLSDALCAAMKSVERLAVVEALLEVDRSDMNGWETDFEAPLCFAIKHERYEVFDRLLEDERSETKCLNGALTKAIEANNERIISALLGNKRCDPNGEGFFDKPISLVLRKCEEQITRKFCEHPKFDVNLKYWAGETTKTREYIPALVDAVALNKVEHVKVLLDCEHIDVNLQVKDATTALSRAVTLGHSAIVKLLLEDDRINVRSSLRELINAREKLQDGANGTLFGLLLAHKTAEINRGDNGKGTLLLDAMEARNSVAVIEILKCGDLDVMAEDSKGRTAFDLARRRGLSKKAMAALVDDERTPTGRKGCQVM